jgi:hypothetical protein
VTAEKYRSVLEMVRLGFGSNKTELLMWDKTHFACASRSSGVDDREALRSMRYQVEIKSRSLTAQSREHGCDGESFDQQHRSRALRTGPADRLSGSVWGGINSVGLLAE